MTKFDLLKEIQQETNRFQKKLDRALKDLALKEEYNCSGNKNLAAVKRSAMDLKMELTRITR